MSNIPEYRLVIYGEIVATSSSEEGARRKARQLAKQNDADVWIEAWRTLDRVEPPAKKPATAAR